MKTPAVTTGYPAKAQWGATSKPGPEPGPPGGAADRTERTRAVTERPSAPRLPHPPGQSRVRKDQPAWKTARGLMGPHTAFAPAPAASQRATGGSAGRRRRRRGRTGSALRKPLARRSCSREIGPPRFHLLALPRAGPAAGTSFHMGLGPRESGQRAGADHTADRWARRRLCNVRAQGARKPRDPEAAPASKSVGTDRRVTLALGCHPVVRKGIAALYRNVLSRIPF